MKTKKNSQEQIEQIKKGIVWNDKPLLNQGKNLKWLRNNYTDAQTGVNSLTLENIADIIGCDIATYRKYEHSQQIVSAVYLNRLVQFYGVSSDFILGRITQPTLTDDYIYMHTGLTADAVKGLKAINKKDDALRSYDVMASIGREDVKKPNRIFLIDILNFILANGFLLNILCSIQDFLTPGYKIPITYDAKGNYNFYDDNNPTQYYPGYKKLNVSDCYMVHLARDKQTPFDSVELQINDDFLDAITIKSIDGQIYKMREKWNNKKRQK